MAQLSRLAQLFHKISNNLTEKDVRDLRSLIATDEILGKAQVENATPLEMFNMLVDTKTIGKGDLGFLVQVLRSLGKTRLADEARDLAEEQKNEESKLQHTDGTSDDSEEEFHSLSETEDNGPEDREPEDGGPEDTEVKETITDPEATGVSCATGNKKTTGVTDAQQVISGLASLHIKDWQRLLEERTGETITSIWPVLTPTLPEDEHDIKVRLENLLTELDTPAVMGDKVQQADLHCQIGDLYRTRLNNLQSALLYYQNMLECSKLLPVTKQAQAHNRLGLTYDMLGKHEEAIRNHERVLEICKDVVGNEANICVAYKNLASSMALSGQGSDAKATYESALVSAEEAGNKTEQMDSYFRLGELHMKQLAEVKASEMYFTKMLTLAVDWGSTYFELLAYNRMGLAHAIMGEYEAALKWHQKEASHESGGKTDQLAAHTNMGNAYRLLGKLDKAISHFDTALQMAQQTENLHGQMEVYFKMGDLQREQLHSPRTAIQYYEQALALARQLGYRRKEGVSYNRLGWAHLDISEYEPALEWYQKHLTISQEIEDKKEEVTAITAVGNAYRFLGNIEQATSHFDTALQLAQQTENLHGQIQVYFWMGEMQRVQLHSPRTSIQYYEQHLALARQLGDRSNEGLAYNGLGRAHYAMGEYGNALEWDMKDLEIRQETVDKTNMLITHQNIADSYKALGKPDQARSHYQSALSLAMETENKRKQKEIDKKLAGLQSCNIS